MLSKDKATIHFFEVEPWERPLITQELSTDVALWDEHVKDIELKTLHRCEILSCFVYSTIDNSILQKLPNLKMIATRSTGFDHIDIEGCKKRGIHVANVPVYGDKTVAEHTFALILALAKKIIPSVERTRSGSFSLEGLRGMDLFGKTLGIIGTGHIGSHVASIAQGFGMKVLAYDLTPQKNVPVTYVSLEDLLKQSDIITLHVPYNPTTHHLIHSGNISLMKKGVLLINTSRGGVIETKALIQGLSENIFGGLGLDVLENEPQIREERELISTLFQKNLTDVSTLLANEYLLHHPKNVIITPHNAFNTHEALERILMTTLQNIQEFQNQKRIHSVF